MRKKKQPVGTGMVPCVNSFGEFIRARRLELDKTQAQINERVPRSGNNNATISMLERGRRLFLASDQVDALAVELGVTSEDLRQRMPAKTREPTTDLGKFVKKRRLELGQSLGAFEKRMGKSWRPAFEMRKEPHVPFGTLSALAKALEVEPGVLAAFGVGQKLKTVPTTRLGQLVRKRRLESDMTGKALAKRLGVSRQYVNQIELGQAELKENPGLRKKIMEVLGLNESDLAVAPPAELANEEGRVGEGELAGTNLSDPTTQNDCSTFGEFVRRQRKLMGFTRVQFVEKSNISYDLLSKIETGKYRFGTAVFKKISDVLGCEIPANLIPTIGKQGRPSLTKARE